jgi:hypothetical protein
VEGICQALANKIVQVLPKVSNKNENVVFKCFGLIEMLFTHTKDQLNRENLGDSLEKSLVPLLGILSGTKLNPFDSELVSLLQLIISTRESRPESQQKSPPSLSSSPSKPMFSRLLNNDSPLGLFKLANCLLFYARDVLVHNLDLVDFVQTA